MEKIAKDDFKKKREKKREREREGMMKTRNKEYLRREERHARDSNRKEKERN